MEARLANPALHASVGAVVRRVVWRILVGLSAGVIAGIVVGGIGGRLAMLLLRLTSPDSAIGVISDDGFEIGVFSQRTLTLVRDTAALGGTFGALYAALRLAIPVRLRVPLWTLFWACAGGALVVKEDGVDFTLLEPALLAILLFVALPGAGAAATALLVERWSAWRPWQSRRLTAGLLAIAAAGTAAVPTAAVIAAIVAAVSLAFELAGPAGRLVRRAALVVVPLALAAVALVAAVHLIRESARILD